MWSTGDNGTVYKAVGSFGISLFGLVANVATVVALLTSEVVLRWVGENPTAMVLISASLLLSSLVLFNYVLVLRKRARSNNYDNQESVCELAELDVDRFRDFMTHFGVDSPLYQWLKRNFYVSFARMSEVLLLRRFVDRCSDDMTNYLDVELAQSFTNLVSALRVLRECASEYYTRPMHPPPGIRDPILVVPPEWKSEDMNSRYNKVVEEISKAHDGVLVSYREFMRIAQAKGLRVR